MQPEHLSLYLLEIHEGTPLAEQMRSGRQTNCIDDEVAAEMYELMIDRSRRCRLRTIRDLKFLQARLRVSPQHEILAARSGLRFRRIAHSFDGIKRYSNERDTAKYVSMIENSGSAEVMRESVDIASEFIFLGLRLNEGVDLGEFQTRFDASLPHQYGNAIAELTTDGLIEEIGTRVRLTRKGMLFSNEVFARICLIYSDNPAFNLRRDR